jgi:hypothetical protein
MVSIKLKMNRNMYRNAQTVKKAQLFWNPTHAANAFRCIISYTPTSRHNMHTVSWNFGRTSSEASSSLVAVRVRRRFKELTHGGVDEDAGRSIARRKLIGLQNGNAFDV